MSLLIWLPLNKDFFGESDGGLKEIKIYAIKVSKVI